MSPRLPSASLVSVIAGTMLLAFPALAEPSQPPLPKGDAAHGEELYAECRGCHALHAPRVGPPHCGVIGRQAGSVEGYHYSEAMKHAGFAWDEAHLDKFLNSPISYLNGTNMGFAGYFDPQDRADMIAYLEKTMDPAVCESLPDPPPPPDFKPAQ
jgi:cytochrome c